MSTYQSLLEQRSELDALIAEAFEREKSLAIEQARELIQKHGLTEISVFGKRRYKKARIIIRPKFYDPVTGGSWSGRGKEPLWIKGKDHAEFAIEKP